MNKIRIGVNGYGVIGKRVADAISAQDDMILSGITYNHYDYRARVAAQKGYRIYPKDSLKELISQSDVIVDCTPKGVGAANKAIYMDAGIKAIFQGGENSDIADLSFVAQANYQEAINKRFLRVLSCNTVGICRIVNALYRCGIVKKVRVTLIRRASDPWESHKSGLLNTVIPETKVPSHQGIDVKTIFKDLDIITLACVASHNLGHLHYMVVETNGPTLLNEVIRILDKEPRIAFINASDGFAGLHSTVELMRDLGRPRNDMWEVAVWKDLMSASSNEIFLTYQVHNEAIVVPENIDAIRAITGIETDGSKSIAKTNASLGITKTFL